MTRDADIDPFHRVLLGIGCGVLLQAFNDAPKRANNMLLQS